ncbi:aromatic amino acid lyase [Streptomyces sp. NPDC047002]|uniref:aromatic amino acid lyase n=1 Tax=Streptomyces sp. NPDC047002 TaxID=3155475 RepID=UPI00345367BF
MPAPSSDTADHAPHVRRPDDLGARAVLRIARTARPPVLAPALLDRIGERRARVLAALASGAPVYGVTTGMGALSERRLSEPEQAGHQEALALARSVGAAPWLDRVEVRAVLAVRLRTFLGGDSGVGGALCARLAELLAADVLPALPRTALGAAGEIIPLAHLSAAVTGRGAVLDPAAPGAAAPAGPALAAAGLAPLALGPKEGVALIQGVPVTTALALLCADRARTVLRQCVRALAGEFALTGAARDALDPALARGDHALAATAADVLRLAGRQDGSRALQPPVSFRVSAQVLAHLERAVGAVEEAVGRALAGVTDSPAYVEEADGAGRFLGTAGFHGYDLAAHLHLLTTALAGAAELGSVRLHRMLDPKVTGLAAQLSPDPGPHTGVSPVHKRAVGVVHGLRPLTAAPTLGTMETSAGQEDVQSFSVEAAESCRLALDGLTDVVACELLALHQARCIGAVLPDGTAELAEVFDGLAAVLPASPEDRFFGEDLAVLRGLLRREQTGE